MQVTLEEAAAKMGKSVRQVRYLLKIGRIQARKVSGRWLVELDELPKTGPQAQVDGRKERRMRALIDDALDVPPSTRRYSVRDLRAFPTRLADLPGDARRVWRSAPHDQARHRMLERARTALADWLRRARGLELGQRQW